MANTYLKAHGVTIQFGSDAAIDTATLIGIPGDEYELIAKPSLADTRIDYDLSDTPDSPTIEVRVPSGSTLPAVGTTQTVKIYLAKASKTLTFTAIVVSNIPNAAEVNGLLADIITLKKTSATVSA